MFKFLKLFSKLAFLLISFKNSLKPEKFSVFEFKHYLYLEFRSKLQSAFDLFL